ncbi:hypothetical protein [Actinoallomurus iriomotensis]|uniref:hypothetical protein n=1 Tax=Actinoallomurus iriomotensis TaxID=478107 RepID=UPI002553A2B2|nr:hypothetical protein [Actinoallomurus iriomotensis]
MRATTGPFTRAADTSPPNYDHLHKTPALPRPKQTDSHIIVRGYATGMNGLTGLQQIWIFFDHLEPALVFSRAGRMSGYDITAHGVYEAARETRCDFELDRDVTTLHVNLRSEFERGAEDEIEIFKRWVRGCGEGPYFDPPK